MADKPKMKYRVVTARNPKTGGSILRPMIVERPTSYIDQVVEYAINAGYVRGQFHDMRGVLNGFIEALQQLGREGKAVNLSNWLRVHAELTGQVGEDRKLTAANDLNVNITALTDLKANVSDFSWQNVDDQGAAVKVESISAPNGTAGEIVKDSPIVATGKNLSFNAAWGDSIKADWLEGTTAKTASLVPSETSETFLRFAWPSAMANVANGTEVTFTFSIRPFECAAEQTVTKVATVRIDPATATVVSITSLSTSLPNQVYGGAETAITGSGLFKTAGDKLKAEQYRGSTLVKSAEMDYTKFIDPTSESGQVLKFFMNDILPQLGDSDAGDTVRFTLITHGGVAGSEPQTLVHTSTVVVNPL